MDLHTLYVEQRMSINDIAGVLAVSASTARARLVTAGVPLRSRADGVRAAGHKISAALTGRTVVMTEEWRRNIAAARALRAEERSVGVSLKPSGYLEFTRGMHKGRAVHVVRMERRLGRPLLPDEVVHHIDEDRTNNEDDNLALMTRAGHARHHNIHRSTQGEE